jgi:hypothetical protein
LSWWTDIGHQAGPVDGTQFDAKHCEGGEELEEADNDRDRLAQPLRS